MCFNPRNKNVLHCAHRAAYKSYAQWESAVDSFLCKLKFKCTDCQPTNVVRF